MFLHRKLHPKTIINPSCRAFRFFSSSSFRAPSEPDPASVGDPLTDRAAAGGSTPSPDLSHSYFKDIKERLSSPSPPRRIPSDPPPPPSFPAASKPAPAASLEEIRKHLFEFKLKSGGSISGDHPPSRPAMSPGNSGPGIGATGPDGGMAFQSIRESLKKFRSSPHDNEGRARSSGFNIKAFQDGLRQDFGPGRKVPQLIGTDNLPESIFGKEMREKKEEGKESVPKLRTTEFLKTYSYEELGQKLHKLRPEKDANKAYCFSLSELNERLAKLRELEENDIESRAGGMIFKDLRESLMRLKDVEAKKKANSMFPIIESFGLQTTPAFMLNPPQEHLLENYFHPDHMSSSEKLKLELKKVRDEFKMSENDCGSTRVQVAQLTTKIKHLSSTLHKKDKHSRKGLHDMVQMRKKLLKYLRRTDWDSYCLVLSKLGLRDVPDYKIPNYTA